MVKLSKSSLESKYNEEPVFYCKDCLSLFIVNLDETNPEDGCYCEKCSRTDIGETDIMSYREMYKTKYGIYPEE
jgi:hypothetical protein